MCLKSRQDLWYLDSGCLRHMSGNTSLFTKIEKKGLQTQISSLK